MSNESSSTCAQGTHVRVVTIEANGHGSTSFGTADTAGAEVCADCGAVRFNNFGPWRDWMRPGSADLLAFSGPAAKDT